MLRFFPSNSSQIGQIKKYYAYNGVLTALSYDPSDFYSHLLIGVTQDGKVKNLSFSACKGESSSVEDSMFSIYFSGVSEIHLTFNSTDLYYIDTIKISERILDNIQKSIFALYILQKNSEQVTQSMKKPELLLRELSKCVNTFREIVKVHSGNRDVIPQDIPMFIELLTSKFTEELNRLLESTAKKTPMQK